MEMRGNKPTGGRSDVLSTSYTGREILSSRISGKRAEHSSDRTNAQAVAVDDQPGAVCVCDGDRPTSRGLPPAAVLGGMWEGKEMDGGYAPPSKKNYPASAVRRCFFTRRSGRAETCGRLLPSPGDQRSGA